MLVDAIGYIGSVAFAVCGIPLAIEVYRAKHARNINLWFLILWTIGEVFTFSYVLINKDWPLVLNYAFNLITLSIVLKYKKYPKDK